MNTGILGWVLIAVGVVAIVAGIGGGIARMFLELKAQAGAGKSFGPSGIELPTELLKALTEFLGALVKAPVWLALVVIGIALVAWGATMV